LGKMTTLTLCHVRGHPVLPGPHTERTTWTCSASFSRPSMAVAPDRSGGASCNGLDLECRQAGFYRRQYRYASLFHALAPPDTAGARHRNCVARVGACPPEHVPTFTHFLDLPILLVIIMLGALRPETWIAFAVGLGVAVMVATVLTVILPRLYPWAPPVSSTARA
jgi:hypothetical protein